MFRLAANFRSTLSRIFTGRRLAIAAAPLLLAGVAAPMMGAGPVDWRIGLGYREVLRPEIIVRTEAPAPRVIERVVETVPIDLHLTAYKARGTIMIFANGANRTGGYATSIAAIDCSGREPRIVLNNCAPVGICNQMVTPFSINAAIHAGRDVRCVSVQVGGRVISVPVVGVPSL